MNPTCLLSANSERYLTRYMAILSQMMAGMSSAPSTDSISGSFISKMLPHHRAAIEMSRNLLDYTTDLTLQRIALDIISEQTDSIAAMERIRRTCSRTLNAKSSAARYEACISSITGTMFARMEAAPALNSIDRDFVLEMIPHHEGAIRMARTALSFSVCPGLTPILRDIVTTQSRSLRQLKELIR